MAVEQGQKPLSLIITAGHWHGSPQFQPVLQHIRVLAGGGLLARFLAPL
ncbi:hypothetical protein [Streptomyces sp. NBC_01190]|nr:hypothetical protein OG519_20385 [Streptomyces sp. NBC_01190]